VTGKGKQLDFGGELGLDMDKLDMLDLLERWSHEDGVGEEDLIEAVVVKSTVGEVMVAAVIVGGFLVVVRLAKVSDDGTTTAGTLGVSPLGSKGRAESELLAFDMGKMVAKVITVESAAARAVETILELCFALLEASVFSGRRSWVESFSDFDQTTFNSHEETTAVVLEDIEEECKGVVAVMVAAISTVPKLLLGSVSLEIMWGSDSFVILSGS